jgi:hypothetical protein
MQSSLKIPLERKFLSTETPFISQSQPATVEMSRFPKVLAMYVLTIYPNENRFVYEWNVTDKKELRLVAQMYYKRYNITTK